jgi:hypothetical protein
MGFHFVFWVKKLGLLPDGQPAAPGNEANQSPDTLMINGWALVHLLMA